MGLDSFIKGDDVAGAKKIENMIMFFFCFFAILCMQTDKLSWKVERSLIVLTTPELLTAVSPTDRPKSVCNRCVIEVLVAFFVVTMLFGFFCLCRGFHHRTESDVFFFLFHSF